MPYILILIFGLNYTQYKIVDKFPEYGQCVKALNYNKHISPKLKNNLFCIKRNELPTANALRGK